MKKPFQSLLLLSIATLLYSNSTLAVTQQKVCYATASSSKKEKSDLFLLKITGEDLKSTFKNAQLSGSFSTIKSSKVRYDNKIFDPASVKVVEFKFVEAYNSRLIFIYFRKNTVNENLLVLVPKDPGAAYAEDYKLQRPKGLYENSELILDNITCKL